MPHTLPPVLPDGTFSSRTQPELEAGGGLVLRPWRAEDATALARAFDDDAIRFWHHRTLDRDEAADWIAATRDQWVQETDGEWAVVEDHRLVGRVALRGVALSIGQSQVSYWTTADARGRGVASRAADRLARWALDEVGFWRLVVRHSTHNPASCRAADAAGFVHEADLVRCHLHADGWHDVHVHTRFRGPQLPPS
jgi:RimJ/RimL family protein N-acetyltransferase